MSLLEAKFSPQDPSGVDVTLQVWEGAIHVFQVFAPIVPEAVPALKAVREFLDRQPRAN